MKTYKIEWTCENLVETVNGEALPADYFDDLYLNGSTPDAPFRPLKRVVQMAKCGGLTTIKARCEEDAISQMARTLRGRKTLRCVS